MAALCCGFYLSSYIYFFPRLISAVRDWMPYIYFHTWCGLSVNLEYRSETCVRGSLKIQHAKNRQKVAILGTIPQLCRAISSQLRHISTIGKKSLWSTHISPICRHNMVNFDLLAAEIDPVVWGTPANFNEFRVLAALLHGSQVVSVSQTAALNRGRNLCSAGRPSRWTLSYIRVWMF